MSRFDEAQREVRLGDKCWYQRSIESLTPTQKKELDEALTSSHIMHTTIVKVLREWGPKVNYQAVSRHRRKVCSCDS